MIKSNKNLYQAVGRRKEATARVSLFPGKGVIIVNGTKIEEYFKYATTVQDVKQPLFLTTTADAYDIKVNVVGGGFTGQAGAIRLGITRALIMANAEFKKILKSEGLVTRDARVKERKKYGKLGARRSPQFSKR